MSPEDIVKLRCISLQPPSEKFSSIMLLGDAPGKDEELAGLPFAGQAGKLLDSMLQEAMLLRSMCVVTNVFHIRPPQSKVEHFFGPKEEGAEPLLTAFPFKGNSRLKEEYGVEIQRLLNELKKWKPKVIVCFGGTALWAMTGQQKVSDHIGKAMTVMNHVILPTWNPTFVLHNKAKVYRDQIVETLYSAKEFSDVE